MIIMYVFFYFLNFGSLGFINLSLRITKNYNYYSKSLENVNPTFRFSAITFNPIFLIEVWIVGAPVIFYTLHRIYYLLFYLILVAVAFKNEDYLPII
jgi:hypothetical protein